MRTLRAMVVRRADAGRDGAVVVATKRSLTRGARSGEIRRAYATCDIGPVTSRYGSWDWRRVGVEGARGAPGRQGAGVAGGKSSRPGMPLMSEVFMPYCRIAKPI